MQVHGGYSHRINASFLGFGVPSTSTHVSMNKKNHQWTGSLAHACEISRRIGRIMANLVKGIDQSVFLRMEKGDCSDCDPTTSKCFKVELLLLCTSSNMKQCKDLQRP